MTCLHDAIADTMERLGKDLDAMPENDRPNKILFAIQTDGLENSSSKYGGPQGLEKVRAMIKHQEEKYGWKILYLGQHLGATQVAHSLGVAVGQSVEVDATPVATAAMYHQLSNAARSFRTTGEVGKWAEAPEDAS
jgi:hypothetical protein